MMASETAVGINLDGTSVQEGDISDHVTIGFGSGEIEGEFVREDVCVGLARWFLSGISPIVRNAIFLILLMPDIRQQSGLGPSSPTVAW